MHLLNSFVRAGTSFEKQRSQNRHIILTNSISLILSAFTLLIFFIALIYFGFISSVALSLLASVIFLTPLILNHNKRYNASRLFLAFSISFITIIISVVDKIDVPGILEEFQYFQFRLILLASCLLPFILFRLSERKYWLPLFITNFTLVALYDPIHYFFGVGYYQVGFSAPNYYFLNYFVIITFFILSGSTYFLKYSFEMYEDKNELLIIDLHHANKVILQQQELLAAENQQLNKEVIETNRQLTETNQELIRHNNDLLQFSYTVSHNLRGPVASLMGLINLLQKENPTEAESKIIHHINKSLLSLNNIIFDLSSIIDIRNAVVQVKQKVIFADEVDSIQSLLIKQIQDQHVTIESDFYQIQEIISVKAMISSILYNLISNAIKYRSPDRAPRIKITSALINSYIRIEVSDNGLGIDLNRFGQNLFGLYKRFHTHTEGKGLGLFLVKLQSEALGGYAEVQSEEGVGTTFCVYLNNTSAREDQVLMDSPLIRIIFNANKNYMLSQWKRTISIEEFKEVSIHISEFIVNYRIPNWIIDIGALTNNGNDLNEVRKDLHHKLQTYGTQRIAFVMPRNTLTEKEYNDRISYIQESYTMPVAFFETIEDASVWVKEENERSTSGNKL